MLCPDWPMLFLIAAAASASVLPVARGQDIPLASAVFDTSQVAVRDLPRSSTVAPIADGYCALAFVERFQNARAFRSRYDFPSDRSWRLLSVSPCAEDKPDKCFTQRARSELLSYAGGQLQRVVGPLSRGEFDELLAPVHGLIKGTAAWTRELTDLVCRDTMGQEAPCRLRNSLMPEPFKREDGDVLGGRWTRKLPGDSALRVLVYERTEHGCALDLTRTGALLDRSNVIPMQLGSGTSGFVAKNEPVPVTSGSSAKPGISERVVRIEFLAPAPPGSGSSPGLVPTYCTGLLLTPDLVLTAGHCVFSERERTTQYCDADACPTHSVEVNYLQNDPDAMEAFVVRSATTLANLAPARPPSPCGDSSAGRFDPDYAILLLHGQANAPAPVSPLYLTKLSKCAAGQPLAPGAAPSLDNNLQIVSHPVGHYQSLSERCTAFSISGRELGHTCFTLPGSSGAPVWMVNGQKATPVAIHTECVAPSLSSRKPDYARNWPDIPLLDAFLRCGLQEKNGAGRAVTMLDIYCRHCNAKSNKTAAFSTNCSALEEIVRDEHTGCRDGQLAYDCLCRGE